MQKKQDKSDQPKQPKKSAAEEAIAELQGTPLDQLPMLSENTKSPDTIQWFAAMVLDNFSCLNGRSSPLFLRTHEQALVFRQGNRWVQFHRGQKTEFWRAVFDAYPDVRESNWSTKRQQLLWDYFLTYAPSGEFDNRRYFETANAVLDGRTGTLNYDEDRFLVNATVRGSELAYEPSYTPSQAWLKWYDGMDKHQKQVRQWSVGAAVTGEYGLLMTFGNSRTGKSTAAEGLAQALGSGTNTFSLSQHWGQFYTQAFDGTTYLYDPDAKGSKNQNGDNYETIHMMASGDPLTMEIKQGASYRTSNYGFMEIISNAPAPLSFERSLIDRVRFCLYTYIGSKADDGEMKGLILKDKQAWLNYAIESAIAFRQNGRPKIDMYQMYGWVSWLKNVNAYGRMCIDGKRALSYSEYKYAYDGNNRYLLNRETVEEMRDAMLELSKQFGKDFLMIDWKKYGEELKTQYYDKTEQLF